MRSRLLYGSSGPLALDAGVPTAGLPVVSNGLGRLTFGQTPVTSLVSLASPLQVPEITAYLNAEQVVRTGADLSAWPNLRSMVNFTVPGSVTVNPQAVTLNGRQQIRFFGDGNTSNAGSWLQSTEQALLTPTRYLNSQATFYVAAVATMDLVTNFNTIWSWSDNTALVPYLGMFGNSDPTQRLMNWVGANGGIGTLLADVAQVPDTDPHLFEVVATVNSPPLANPGVYQKLYVDGIQRAENLPAATTSNYGAFNVCTIGAIERSAGFDNPMSGYIRSLSLAYPKPSASNLSFLRQFFAADGGVTLLGNEW